MLLNLIKKRKIKLISFSAIFLTLFNVFIAFFNKKNSLKQETISYLQIETANRSIQSPKSKSESHFIFIGGHARK